MSRISLVHLKVRIFGTTYFKLLIKKYGFMIEMSVHI